MTTGQQSPTPAVTRDSLMREAARLLTGAGVDGARAEARWLLARTLSLSESAVLAHGDELVEPVTVERYRALVWRRVTREPFAYVVGEREFYGRSFLVDRRALVPRPETETLIEEAMRALAEQGVAEPLVVDVGAGSGAIACTMALEAPAARVIACDVSAEALAVSAANRDHLGLSGGAAEPRLRLVHGSLLSWLGHPADIVMANLPYLPSSRVPTLMPEVRDWEPLLALDGGADGLTLVARLLADSARTVRPGGTILLELDPEQMAPARALAPHAAARVIPDLAGLDRVLRLDLPQ